MRRIKTTDEELKHSLRFARSFLSVIGAWPEPIASPLLSTILDWFIIVFSYVIIMLVIVPGVLHITIREKIPKNQLKLLVPHLNAVSQVLKYTILLCRTNEFRKVLEEIRDDWFNAMESNRAIFRAKAKIGQNMVLIVAIVMYTSGICYRTLPLSKGRIVLPDNTTTRLLPCPSYFVFFNEQLTPYYEIIYVLQYLNGFLVYTILCGSVGAFALLSLHICSLLTILMNKMMELTDQSDVSEDAIQRKILDIVEYQAKIKRFMNDIEKITQYLCFVEIVVGTCSFCTSGYCLITEWEHSNATVIAIYLAFQALNGFAIFTMCYIGQLVIDESNNVRLTSITLNWYRFPMRKARSLIPVIIISSYPIKLTAGKVVDVSLNTFVDVMKAAVGYLNVLREAI
ncbi:unnamed protein product [Xylocopa violacea]|uniref:Odorant receptor n=1 Tax=Xylocopa violacea TaxID=135666 RepID=A0ABP1N6R6_XYLVO